MAAANIAILVGNQRATGSDFYRGVNVFPGYVRTAPVGINAAVVRASFCIKIAEIWNHNVAFDFEGGARKATVAKDNRANVILDQLIIIEDAFVGYIDTVTEAAVGDAWYSLKALTRKGLFASDDKGQAE